MKIASVRTSCGFTIQAIESTLPLLDEIWSGHAYDVDFPIERNAMIVDVGANQGFFSLYAASKGATVHSFEPEPRNFAMLERNIAANDLQGRVHAWNLAIGRRDGSCELYVPEDDVELGSVMVTGDQGLSRLMFQGRARRVRVPCLTLARALALASVATVDTLKLDCEGAELDILASAPAGLFAAIRHIVMESHCNYSEKDLSRRLLDLGYHLVRLRKMGGRFGTGFLAASRDHPQRPLPPAAIISCIKHVTLGEQFVADGGPSFATASGSRSLTFAWSVDGSDAACTTNQLRTAFSSLGEHTVELKVSDGQMRDRASSAVWVMEPSYGSRRDAVPLGPPGVKTLHTVHRESHFVIAKEAFPTIWLPDRLIVQIIVGRQLRAPKATLMPKRLPPGPDALEQGRLAATQRPDDQSVRGTPDKSVRHGFLLGLLGRLSRAIGRGRDASLLAPAFGVLRINGITVRLDDGFTRVALEHFPVDLDLHLSIDLARRETVDLCWWPEPPTDAAPKSDKGRVS